MLVTPCRNSWMVAPSAREHIIDLPHDPLGRVNRSGYERLGSRAGASVGQIVRGFSSHHRSQTRPTGVVTKAACTCETPEPTQTTSGRQSQQVAKNPSVVPSPVPILPVAGRRACSLGHNHQLSPGVWNGAAGCSLL